MRNCLDLVYMFQKKYFKNVCLYNDIIATVIIVIDSISYLFEPCFLILVRFFNTKLNDKVATIFIKKIFFHCFFVFSFVFFLFFVFVLELCIVYCVCVCVCMCFCIENRHCPSFNAYTLHTNINEKSGC